MSSTDMMEVFSFDQQIVRMSEKDICLSSVTLPQKL